MTNPTDIIIFITAICYLLFPFLLKFKKKTKLLFIVISTLIILSLFYNDILLVKIFTVVLMLIPLILMKYKMDSL